MNLAGQNPCYEDFWVPHIDAQPLTNEDLRIVTKSNSYTLMYIETTENHHVPIFSLQNSRSNGARDSFWESWAGTNVPLVIFAF